MQTHSSAPAATASATHQSTVPVLDIGSLPLQLEDLTRERIKALPKPALQELSVLRAAMDRGIKHAREQLTAALDDLYGDAARAQLLEAGKDTGTTHLKDGELAITVEIKKSIAWDQQKLAAIAQRIASNGDDPAEYIDVKYSVCERKFAAWPETLRRPFEAARTLKPAKPVFRLALVGEGNEWPANAGLAGGRPVASATATTASRSANHAGIRWTGSFAAANARTRFTRSTASGCAPTPGRRRCSWLMRPNLSLRQCAPA